MSGPDRRGLRALVHLWNFAWDVRIAAACIAAAWLADAFLVHRGVWWVALAAAAGFVAFEVGVRLGWMVVLALLGPRDG